MMGELMNTPESMTAGLFVVATAPAGWYQVNDQARRWFDGHRWTEYYAPVITRVISQRFVSDRGAGDIGLNVMMVIMTLGMWLPVWGVLAAVRGIRHRHFRRLRLVLGSRSRLAPLPVAH